MHKFVAGAIGSLKTIEVVQGKRGNAADRLQQLLPEAAWGTLEVLVMEPRQLAQELEAGERPTLQQPSPPPTPGMPAASLMTLTL